MLQETINTFREVLKALQGQESKVKADLEKALQRREELHTLPLPLSDQIATAHELIDGSSNNWPKRLKRKLSFLQNTPLRDIENMKGLFNPVRSLESSNADPAALLYCFKDQIKAGVTDAITSWGEPENPGPTRAQRFIELKTLDKDIASLQGKLKKIRGAAESESTSLMGVAKGTKGDRKLLVKPK